MRLTFFLSGLSALLLHLGAARAEEPPAERILEMAVYTAGRPAEAAVSRARRELTVNGRAGLVQTPPIEEYAPPALQLLAAYGRGLDEAKARAVSASKGAIVLVQDAGADPGYANLRRMQTVVAALADETGGCPWDESTRQVYSREAWRVAGWEGPLPDAEKHYVVHYYRTPDGRHRVVTLGLEKFGVPDLVIQDAPPQHSQHANTAIKAVAQLLVEGASLVPGQPMAVKTHAIRHAGARAAFLRPIEFTVDLVPARPEEGDPPNRLLALRFGRYPGKTDAERLAAAGPDLENAQMVADGDADLEAARVRVQSRLPDVAERYRRAPPAKAKLTVKSAFRAPDGRVEWMWVGVTAWKGPALTGTLLNTPFWVPALKAGDTVTVAQGDIAEYLLKIGDAPQEGGESDAILRQRREAPGTEESGGRQAPPP